jgi:hypothetical protein
VGNHSDLEKAMRLYIQEHPSEFLPEGIEPVVIDLNGGLLNQLKWTVSKATEDEFKPIAYILVIFVIYFPY